MSKSLVIVESPTKARTIGRFLDRDYKVVACMGHVRDLPERTLGIDVKQGFEPKYVLTPSGKKVMAGLRREARQATDIYLATDPDREGEAIAWHLAEELQNAGKAEFHRVSFHEITPSAIQRAFAEAQSIDQDKVAAQQARRILDRLVGYKVSPLLWQHVKKGTSAGRVQSVALRLVCERERAIRDFKSEEYWTLTGWFSPLDKNAGFAAQLFKLDGKKPVIPDGDSANRLAAEIDKQSFAVTDRITQRKQQRAAPPFITSTLQQVAGARLRMTTRQTMATAQQLYEGVDLADSGATGLITYMRTDSFAVAKDAQEAARAFIAEAFGPEYVPEKPNRYRARKAAQEAHEAIRPTDPRRTPESLASHLTPPQLKLYRLIWQRFVASQMAPAQLRQTSLELKPQARELEHDYLFRSTVTETVFPGFTKVFQDRDIDDDDEDQKKTAPATLPDLGKGDPCRLLKLDREQSFTQPPKRFSEATLVRELEQNGVGRPSTYSSIVNTIQTRRYVEREKGRLLPTELGFAVNDYLVANMDRLFQVKFTADMEDQLDAVEEGRENMVHMLERFYGDFSENVTDAELLDAPHQQEIARLLAAFPESLAWREPSKVGRRVYDDQKFFLSLKEQAEKGEKPLSDKQWRALLALAARYADQIPGLDRLAEDLGIDREMRQLVDRSRENQADNESEAAADPMAEALLDKLDKVAWQPPQKRGSRTYDDAKFYRSLKRQKESGRALSPAQKKALTQLALRYREQIPDFESWQAEHGLNFEDLGNKADKPAMTDDEKKKVQEMIEALARIEQWKEPRKVRGRVFDDREFADSIRGQWQSRGSLSPRQIAALRRLLQSYGENPES